MGRACIGGCAMSLFEIYKAKRLGLISSESLFNASLGKMLGYEILTDKAPYVKRVSANGADIGTKCVDKLVGGTVAWNQRVPKPNKASETIYDVVFTNNADGSIKAEGTASGEARFYLFGYSSTSRSVGKGKLLLLGCPSGGSSNTYRIEVKGSSWAYDTGNGTIFENTQDTVKSFCVYVKNGTSVDKLFKPQIFNLTQMFGSAIADYVYSLEQGTAGAGVAWVRDLFKGNEYFSYNEGKLMSVNTSARITKDANNNIVGNYALDETLTLRGIPKLDASNNLYYDGDVYESDGKVTRYYGIRAYQSGDATDGSTMVTDGVNTVYKLVTPTIETADPFTNPQKISKNGTEEYVDYSVLQGLRDVSVPVGHNTEYQVIV